MGTGISTDGVVIGRSDDALYMYDARVMTRPLWRGLNKHDFQAWQPSYMYPHDIPAHIRITIEELTTRELQWILEYCLSQS